MANFTFDEEKLDITFPNGVRVSISAENYTSKDDFVRAYVSQKEPARNLLFHPKCPANREMDGNALLKLLTWAANYKETVT